MTSTRSVWKISACIAALAAVGIPYWVIPYNKVNLPDALLGPGLVVVCISSLLLCLYHIAPFWRATLIMGATVPGVVIIRVLVEGVRDPTSHNLWPFEVIIAGLVGVACAGPGAVAGVLLMKLLKPHQDRATL